MRVLLRTVVVVIALCSPALAQYVGVNGTVQLGGRAVTLGGLPPTNTKWMQTFPGATVSVCVTGTSCASLAPIYTSSTGGAKSNPFPADATTAAFQFFVAPGIYDIRFSGMGILTPWTISNVSIEPNGLGNGITVIDATRMNGADMGVKIQNAQTQVYIFGGGKVDSRGFVCPTNCQIGTANLTIGDSTYPVTVMMPEGVTTLGSGLSILTPYSNAKLTCDTPSGCQIQKVNTINDFTPMVYAGNTNATAYNQEFSNLKFLATTQGGTPMPISSVASAVHTLTFPVSAVAASTTEGLTTYTISGTFLSQSSPNQQPWQYVDFSGLSSGDGTNLVCPSWTSSTITCWISGVTAQPSAAGTMTVYTSDYTGTFTTTGWSSPLPTSCASNACSGYIVRIFGYTHQPTQNIGYFIVAKSTGSVLSLANLSGVAETAGTSCGTGCTVTLNAMMDGAPGIYGWNVQASVFHDLGASGTDTAFRCENQCTYDAMRDVGFNSTHGAIYLADVDVFTFTGDIGANAGDDGSTSYANAYGYGVWINANYINFAGATITSENTKYTIWNAGQQNSYGVMYLENDIIQGLNLAGITDLPTLLSGSQNNKFLWSQADVNDLSGNNTNQYGTSLYNNPVVQPAGSVNVSGIADPTKAFAFTYTCSGSTTYRYGIVGVDFNGNKTNLYETDVTNNATLGATACSGGTPAQNEISGFDGWANTSALNGIHGFDILKFLGGAWKSLALNVPPTLAYIWLDDGTMDAGAQAYVVPTRNSTKDVIVTGMLSESGGFLSAGLITLSTGTGSHNFSVAYGSAPVCTANDTTDGTHTFTLTAATGSISIAGGHNSDVISWHCQPASN